MTSSSIHKQNTAAAAVNGGIAISERVENKHAAENILFLTLLIDVKYCGDKQHYKKNTTIYLQLFFLQAWVIYYKLCIYV